MQAILVPNRDNLLEHKNKKKSTTRAQNDIVDLEKGCELEGLAGLHDGLDRENSGQVANERGDDDLVGGHGCDALDIGVEMDGKTVGDSGEEEVCESHDRTNDRSCKRQRSIFERVFGG